MTSNPHTLSICIPTFNRLHYLKESLDILLPQAQRLSVDVCVSDNHSTDATVEYLKAMAVRFTCLHYKVQEENIGLDKNMLSAISMGKGAYIYPLGDDDFLPEGTVGLLLKKIIEDLDMLLLNGWHTDPFLIPKSEHLPTTIKEKTFLTPDEAFINVWHKMPFGSFLAARELFLPVYFDRFIGTSHAYTGAVWDVLAEKYRNTGKCTVKCMSAPTVLLRGGEKSWRADAAKIMLYEIPLWFQLIMEDDTYRQAAKPIFNKYIQSQTRIMSLLSYRASGQLDKQLVTSLTSMYSARDINLINKIINLPVAPLKLFYAIYYISKKILKQIIRR